MIIYRNDILTLSEHYNNIQYEDMWRYIFNNQNEFYDGYNITNNHKYGGNCRLYHR